MTLQERYVELAKMTNKQLSAIDTAVKKNSTHYGGIKNPYTSAYGILKQKGKHLLTKSNKGIKYGNVKKMSDSTLRTGIALMEKFLSSDSAYLRKGSFMGVEHGSWATIKRHRTEGFNKKFGTNLGKASISSIVNIADAMIAKGYDSDTAYGIISIENDDSAILDAINKIENDADKNKMIKKLIELGFDEAVAKAIISGIREGSSSEFRSAIKGNKGK